MEDLQYISDLSLKLDFYANQIVEGYINGIHKSPFHGYSSEFSEHRLYNQGESTKHIDWKVYARTDKLYTKKYEEETNFRCQFILDNSSSMLYPYPKNYSFDNLNKLSFSCLAIASLSKIMEKQREAIGLSIYNKDLHLNTEQKSSRRQYSFIYNQLKNVLSSPQVSDVTTDIGNIDKIILKLRRRSVVVLFTDLLGNADNSKLFKTLKHLKFNKHQVILFHVYDSSRELYFNFPNKPMKFTDLETGEQINLFSDQHQSEYNTKISQHFKEIKKTCLKYKINYYDADITKGFYDLINNFMIKKQYYSY